MSNKKIIELSKKVFNEKDFNLVMTFLAKKDYYKINELATSESKKEYRNCVPDKMTDKYCDAMDLIACLSLYDLEDDFIVYNDEKYYDDDNF